MILWHFTAVSNSLYVKIANENRRARRRTESLISIIHQHSTGETELQTLASSTTAPPPPYDEVVVA